MRYLYTDTPDDECHEIAGVWGKPVHNSMIPKLLKAGWKKSPEEVMPIHHESEGDDLTSLSEMYEQRFGKKPHHRMTAETIAKAIDDHDKAAASESDSDTAGD